MSGILLTAAPAQAVPDGQEIFRRAEALVPILRERARGAEQARRIQNQTIADAQDADLLRLMAPGRFGGLGMGVFELCEVSRILAQGDASAAWVIGFLIEHNWLVGRLPMTAQERLYRDAAHINSASALQPGGQARRVEGGFLVSGRWSYASGIHHSPWTFVHVGLDGDEGRAWVMLLAVADGTVIDDWHMAGMAATGSASFMAQDVFVPQDMAITMDCLHSAKDHPGAMHPEPVYRYPVLPAAAAMLASFPLGAAQGALALACDRFTRRSASGERPIDREAVRLRWAEAHQKIRGVHLIWSDMLARITAKADASWSDQDNAQIELDRVSIVHGCKEAVWLLMDGLGSSAARLDDPIQRHARDIQLLANHIAHARDQVISKAAMMMF